MYYDTFGSPSLNQSHGGGREWDSGAGGYSMYINKEFYQYPPSVRDHHLSYDGMYSPRWDRSHISDDDLYRVISDANHDDHELMECQRTMYEHHLIHDRNRNYIATDDEIERICLEATHEDHPTSDDRVYLEEPIMAKKSATKAASAKKPAKSAAKGKTVKNVMPDMDDKGMGKRGKGKC